MALFNIGSLEGETAIGDKVILDQLNWGDLKHVIDSPQ